uniref:Uncharacterized protein n=1 Tax=Cacopsylla melanoneura TaxID=428564 RepID=A0A8D8T6D1_9HEMI
MIPSQKSMPIYRSQVQHMTSSKTKLQNIPTNQLTIEQNISETNTNNGSQYSNPSQNLMSNYPTSVQNIAKVYPLSRVFPHRRTESCGVQTKPILAVREPNMPTKTTTCQPIGDQKSITMSIPSQQELGRNSSKQIQIATSAATSRASLTKNQPTKSTSSILIGNTVKPKDLSQQDLNRNTNSNQSNQIQKVGPRALSKTSITKQQPAKNNSSVLIRSEKPATRGSVKENIQAFEQKNQQEEYLKQNIGKELTVKTLKTSQQCFPKSTQKSYVEISSKAQESQTRVSKNAQEKSRVCLPLQQSQKSVTKVLHQESIGKLGKQESQQKLSMHRKSHLEVSKAKSKCQQTVLKPVPSNQHGVTSSQKSSQQEMTRSQKISPQEIEKLQKSRLQKIAKSQEDVSMSAPTDQQEMASYPRSEDTDSISVHTQTLSDKSTQFEDIYQDSLNVETAHSKTEQKRPATTSDNRQRMPHPAAEKFRTLSSKPRKSYVEIYQQQITSKKKIPVPISKLHLKPRKVEEKIDLKKSTPEGGGNKNQLRKGKVTPKMMNDSTKTGGVSRNKSRVKIKNHTNEGIFF